MKNIIIIIVLLFGCKSSFAQQQINPIRISLKDKKDKLVHFVSFEASLYVEGYDGDEIIIEPYKLPVSKNIPADAIGLKNITAITNQSIFPHVEMTPPYIKESSQEIYIKFPFPNPYRAILIKVPKATHLNLQYVTALFDAKVSLKNLSGGLELSGNTPLTEINNISGPITLSSTSYGHSKIDISNIKWDPANVDKTKFLLYLSSSASDFDISLPDDMKATLSIHSENGESYSDFNIVRKFPESSVPNYFMGDINGGGVGINIITGNGNIFISKQK